MMTSAQLVFCLTFLLLGEMGQKIHLTSSSSVYQESSFISAHVGEKVTLKCFHEDAIWLSWYMQPLGEKPTLISSFYAYGGKITFQNNPRYSLTTENRTHHLTILDLKSSDSATYYCASSSAVELDFADGTTVSVKDSDSNIKPLIHESSLEIIQPGDSVTLSCTVQTGTCDGKHNVYWFKDSGESHSALLYTSGDWNDQCERNPNTQTHTCVYNLLMKNLNVSHAGTYYCAVASCGYILFGTGTKLDFNDEDKFAAYFWNGVFSFTSILCVLLALSVCLMNRNSSSKSSAESKAGSSRLPTDVKGGLRPEIINRAAFSGSEPQMDSTWSECVFYVKQ